MSKLFQMDSQIPTEGGTPSVPTRVPTPMHPQEPSVPAEASLWEQVKEFLLQVQPWMWLLAVLLIIAVILLLLLLRKNKKAKQKKEEQPEVVPMEKPQFSISKVHGIGARESQQDSFSISPEELMNSRGLLAVVADGMGGLSDGDKVSQLVVSSMMEGFFVGEEEPQQRLYRLVQEANCSVNSFLSGKNGRSGSTVVAGLLKDDQFHYISVGDSRISLYRNGQLMQLNREHIYRNELMHEAVNKGKSINEAYRAERGGSLTSYLGMGQLKYVDAPAAPIRIQPGDKLILMSDGIYNTLSNGELEDCLLLSAQEAAEQIETLIKEKALSHQDNYTAVILSC